MKHIISLTLLLCINTWLYGQVKKIDHFFIANSDSRALYDYATEDLKLPIVFEYKDYGEFSSGGVSLGNTIMEFVTWNDPKKPQVGILYEPSKLTSESSKSASASSESLSKVGISHEVTEIIKGDEFWSWRIVHLNDIFPKDILFAICAYENREKVDQKQSDANNQLQSIDGGLLGIEKVMTLVLETQHPDQAHNKLAKFEDASFFKNTKSLSYSAGSNLQVTEGDKTAIKEIVLKVKSVTRALETLPENKYVQKYDQGFSLGPFNFTLVDSITQ